MPPHPSVVLLVIVSKQGIQEELTIINQRILLLILRIPRKSNLQLLQPLLRQVGITKDIIDSHQDGRKLGKSFAAIVHARLIHLVEHALTLPRTQELLL